jgi:hypothetical protein
MLSSLNLKPTFCVIITQVLCTELSRDPESSDEDGASFSQATVEAVLATLEIENAVMYSERIVYCI